MRSTVADLLTGNHALLLEKVLDFRTLRQNVISANIANAETPNYKAVRVEFDSQLREAIRKDDGLRLRKTNGRHFTATPPSLEDVQPAYMVEAPPMSGNDHNSVDVEREMARLSDNQLMFNATAQSTQSWFATLKAAIQESGR
ncbi:MAG: flagellar basal body rod protein FlgB [Nitrospirae bacterium]|nr:flagellar basal body rod protein FlgB [Nitrospirota bacterium]